MTTIVVETSALMAILEQEPDANDIAKALAAAGTRWISTATAVEAGIVIRHRRGEGGAKDLDDLLAAGAVEMIPLTPDHVRLAWGAFETFGKGRHRAGLNLGDCYTYALAKASGNPLLFKGDDFRHTDLGLVDV